VFFTERFLIFTPLIPAANLGPVTKVMGTARLRRYLRNIDVAMRRATRPRRGEANQDGSAGNPH
jgi:hypothetical protein